MKLTTLETIKNDKMYARAIPFITALLGEGVPLDCIDTNDFHCNLYPSVYVHNKTNQFKVKKYRRMSLKDIDMAIAFYNADNANRLTKYTVC